MLVNKSPKPGILVLQKGQSPYAYIVGAISRLGNEFYDIRGAALVSKTEKGGMPDTADLGNLVFDGHVEIHVRNVVMFSELTGDMLKVYQSNVMKMDLNNDTRIDREV